MENGNRNGEKGRRRILTDARKEQNRVAQRAYRQRQKERTQKLHGKSRAWSGRQKLRTLQPCIEQESSATDANGAAFVPQPVYERSLTSLNTNTNDIVEQTGLYQRPIESGWVPLSDFVQATDFDPNGHSFPVAPRSIPAFASSITDLHPGWDLMSIGMSDLASGLHGDLDLDAGLFHILDDSSSQETQNMNAENSIVRFEVRDQLTSLNAFTPSSLPNPYMNCIPVCGTSILTAGLQNAICLGITLQELVTSKYRSPFYRFCTPADDSKALLAAASNPSFPAHLQPTLPQILFPHHAYLDLLPFPILRARAITLAATRPQLFHPMDLKQDIMRDGLVYLRSSVGDGSTGGQSWDMRSWQVAPWFLKKWRMLIAGEDGDLWR